MIDGLKSALLYYIELSANPLEELNTLLPTEHSSQMIQLTLSKYPMYTHILSLLSFVTIKYHSMSISGWLQSYVKLSISNRYFLQFINSF